MGSYEAFVCIDRLDAIGIYDEAKKIYPLLASHSPNREMIIFWRNEKNFVSLHSFSQQKVIVQWCNGSTPDFGSVSLGSNPGWTTKSRGG